MSVKCPEFNEEVALLIQDFVYSKEDIEFSFTEENVKQANLISLYVENKCITAVLMDQHEKEFMYLGYMSTLGKWRRKGIGKTMMKLVVRLCYMMSKELEDIYLISRNIQDENGKWYSVKESPVYRFWESLGFVRIPWGKFPSIPTVLEQGTILTQARAYRFHLSEGNYNDYIQGKTIEQFIAQLRIQTKSEKIHLKVFSPSLHSEQMKWPPLPKAIADKESSMARFQPARPQMPPSYFSQRLGQNTANPMMMQQEIAFNNMMLQSMYMNQMIMMQQNMYVQARRRYAMQLQHQQQTTQSAAPATNLLAGTQPPQIAPSVASTNQLNSNIVPAKRKLEPSSEEDNDKKKRI